MIICPSCKEEIDDDSYYCDQCGQALLYCDRCGRVGIGRRCTYCGGLMVSPSENRQSSLVSPNMSLTSPTNVSIGSRAMPVLTLYNSSMNIRIQGINGAIIGRRQGPYSQYFEQNKYVSGVHAQLKYNASSGWSIIDKHSSNGTQLNQRPIQPDVEMSLKNGDILSIANINFQVNVN